MSTIIKSDRALKFTDTLSVEDMEIHTPTGWKPIKEFYKTIEYEIYEVKLADGKTLKCADKHILIDSEGQEVFVDELEVGEIIATEDDDSPVVEVKSLGYKEECYDLWVDDDIHHYYTNGIVSHNTTTASAYILHQAITRKDITIAILANKEETAKEILDRIKFAYSMMPWYMKPGVLEWNKKSILLANGSKGVKIFIGACSPDAIRGKSCIAGESIITIKTATGDIVKSSIKDIKDNYIGTRILTRYGWKEYGDILSMGIKPTIKLFFSDGSYLVCTPDHEVLLDKTNSFVEAGTLKLGDYCSGKKLIDISEGETQEVFDVFDVDGVHEFIASGLSVCNCSILYIDEYAYVRNANEFYSAVYPTLSAGKTTQFIITSTPKGMNHFYKLWKEANNQENTFSPFFSPWWENPTRDDKWAENERKTLGNEQIYRQEVLCDFIGSALTLISGDKLNELSPHKAIKEDDDIKIYEEPQENHRYISLVDVSEGLSQDYAVVNVIDVTSTPYKQVAVFRNNLTQPEHLAHIVYTISNTYNQAFTIVENNSIGKIVGDALYYDYEYENILTSVQKLGETEISEGVSRLNVGLRQTTKTKRIGCAKLKSLIESNQLLITDATTIDELISFIKEGNTYKADKGATDDICMTLVMFGWLVSTPQFKSLAGYSSTGEREVLSSKDKDYGMFIKDDGLTDNSWQRVSAFMSGGGFMFDNNKPQEKDSYGSWDDVFVLNGRQIY